MNQDRYNLKIAAELGIRSGQVKAVADLLAEKATVPFISRYRKEVTGGLDEVQIIAIRDRLEQLEELDKRREAILKSLEEQEKLTPELEKAVNEAETLSRLEDIYLPYRPKRRTRGMIAREKGLEPLAEQIFAQEEFSLSDAAEYISEENEVASADEALAGARDIIAEWVNEDSETRADMRRLFSQTSSISSKVLSTKKDDKEAAKFRDYFEWTEPIGNAPSHRILAIRRGADEGFLSYHILPEEEDALDLLEQKYVSGRGPASEQVELALKDCYKRLLSLSMETEIRAESKLRADEEAITVFAENLRELLLASPLGQKTILALDPGLRTGCKLVCLDAQGNLLHHEAIYPLAPHNKVAQSASTIKTLVKRYNIEAIAIGNGTGGREALSFCKEIEGLESLIIMMVNESGASVYSASAVAREEFPKEDVTVRGAVSIGRRLMDPLAELVKIDPKSIGVGQYQHDVDQRHLKKQLDDVVVSCVNAVGVDVNTASKQLLSYVSGLSSRIAGNIVDHRAKNGAFSSRKELSGVSGMGPKTFEQAAGFLRIRNGVNPLDASAVHPESYGIVEKMASDKGCAMSDLLSDRSLRSGIKLDDYVTESVGIPTLTDIMAELDKPGRDPRKEFEIFSFTEGVNEVRDLNPGMVLPGVVTNVTNFGAFVDVGVHQDGLVHISHLSDDFVSNPHDVVKVNQKVSVRVLEVDLDRKRISLSMKSEDGDEQSVLGKKTEREKRDLKRERGQQRPRRQESGGNTIGDALAASFKNQRGNRNSDRRDHRNSHRPSSGGGNTIGDALFAKKSPRRDGRDESKRGNSSGGNTIGAALKARNSAGGNSGSTYSSEKGFAPAKKSASSESADSTRSAQTERPSAPVKKPIKKVKVAVKKSVKPVAKTAVKPVVKKSASASGANASESPATSEKRETVQAVKPVKAVKKVEKVVKKVEKKPSAPKKPKAEVENPFADLLKDWDS